MYNCTYYLRRSSAFLTQDTFCNYIFPFFSCSQGYVRVHEVLVRNFTTILDGLVGGSEAVVNEARDPYGGLNIIIPSLDRETLQCLTEMLYRSRRHLLNRINFCLLTHKQNK